MKQTALQILGDRLEEAGVDASDLDELLHEMCAAQASDANNGGVRAQLTLLAQHLSLQMLRTTLANILPGWCIKLDDIEDGPDLSDPLSAELAEQVEIYRLWDLCTNHMTFDDSELLTQLIANREQGTISPVIGTQWTLDTHYGDLLRVPSVDAEGEEGEWLGELEKAGFSESFVAICRLAQKHQVSYIKLDRDGHAMESLPLHEW